MDNYPYSNMTVNSSLLAAALEKDKRDTENCLLYDFLIEAVFMGMLCLFGFAGNTLSMICLWKDKSKTATPFLLISLELADTLFLVTVLILRVTTSIHQFTNWFTMLSSWFSYFGTYIFPCALIAMTSTIYLTILVTVNRYISVCRPYDASSMCSIQQARKQVVLVCVLCIVYNIPRFFEYNVKTEWNPVTNTTTIRSFRSLMGRHPVYQYFYVSALYFIVMFLVPLITLIILNYKLICALRETKKRRAKLLTHSDSHSHSEDDITLTLIVVVLVFLLTQTPALITQVLLSSLSAPYRQCPSHFYYYVRLSDLMVVANSASNFIIYCFCSKRFRQILIELTCKRPTSNNAGHHHHHHHHHGGTPSNNASQHTAHIIKHYKPVANDEKTRNGHTEVTAL